MPDDVWHDPAVLARSALAAADVLLLTGDGAAATAGGHSCDGILATSLDDAHVTLEDGRVVLAVTPGTPLAGARLARRRHPSGPGVPVALHVTDLAHAPLRDRVRAHVTLWGRLGPVDAAAVDDVDMAALRPLIGEMRELWVLTPDHVLVEAGGRLCALGPGAWRSARADVLAGREGGLLAEVADLVASLADRLPAPLLAASHRILPLGLDARGIVLRAEGPAGHTDVRLRFDAEISRAADVRDALRGILRRHRAAALAPVDRGEGRIGRILDDLGKPY